MSDRTVEAAAATNTSPPTKGEILNKENTAVPTVEKDESVEIEPKDTETNGTSNINEDDVKDEKTVERKYENGVLKTSRKIDETNYKNNSKYDPSILPETDDAQAIRNQVEFYFSDSNLPTDKHMWEMTDGATNLPISIESICKFGRMKRFKPLSAVVAALKESTLLEVTGAEGQEQVKRKVPYDPAIPRAKAESRSVYVKGFGDEEPSSQFDIEAFFAPYGPTRAVRLRRTDEKLFKGSVFVEFDSDEIAQKFLALDPKPLWKGKHELLIQSKRAYQEKKNEEIREGKTQPKKSWAPGGRGGNRGRGRGRGDHRGDKDNRGRRDRDPDDWKKRREDDRANGFKDNKGGKDRNQRGRGGRRDDRGNRNNDRNREREEKNGEKSEADVKNQAATPEKNEKKRDREDDVETAPAAKKVDTKSEVATEAS